MKKLMMMIAAIAAMSISAHAYQYSVTVHAIVPDGDSGVVNALRYGFEGAIRNDSNFRVYDPTSKTGSSDLYLDVYVIRPATGCFAFVAITYSGLPLYQDMEDHGVAKETNRKVFCKHPEYLACYISTGSTVEDLKSQVATTWGSLSARTAGRFDQMERESQEAAVKN
jgi:hypothetical protein